ncbi:MAG TPA: DinB family protein, partial [Dehalococcoidia bacterium]|nr:DinB family protein [Dehalococcoidia bacterium]
MIDVDRFYLGEAIAMRDQDDHLFTYFDDEQWKRDHPDVRLTSLADVLLAMQISHAQVLKVLAAMSEVALSRPGRHPRGIPYAVRDVFLRLPAHDQNHELQIEAILALL